MHRWSSRWSCWKWPIDGLAPIRLADRGECSERGADLLLMRVVQHFDQAVFQLEALVQQLAEAFQLGAERGGVATVAVVAAVVEGQRHFGDGLDARVDLLGQLQAAL